MSKPLTNWSVGPYTVRRSRLFGRPAGPLASPDHPHAVERHGARITDHDNAMVYEALIDRDDTGRAWVTSLTILTTRKGQRIDSAALAKVPTRRIAETVAMHVDEAITEFTTDVASGETPSTRQVARLMKAGLNRRTLAARYGASVYAADKWIARARDEGLLPPATTGRPRNTTGEDT